ncbi:hypothetical protein ACQKP8_03520 [Photobacterium alginatilyticum]|uniref:hypothetical protein n=1 Tax=Photobacterium alginatilyticum TaxID=1775171 RepID=UPI0040682D82
MNKIEQSKDYSWWLKETPCIHRIHEFLPKKGAHRIQQRLGMSLSLTSLEIKLKSISEKVQESNRKDCLNQKALITFDDGHRDVLLSLPLLAQLPELQPVLFLTGRQLRGETIPLPLTALYEWCDENNLDPNNLKDTLGFNRESLKRLPESEQRKILISNGIDINPQGEEMLSSDDIKTLIKNNWLIGYHGIHHCDLRIYLAGDLEVNFKEDLDLLQASGFMPWIAWPEGRWNDNLFSMAKNIGFDKQFGLHIEKGIGSNLGMVNRVIWK